MIEEFHGLQRVMYRVDSQKAGRLAASSSASVGDAIDVRDDGYNWQFTTLSLWRQFTSSVMPFSFLKVGELGGDVEVDQQLVASAANHEAQSLPMGLPAHRSTVDFVPFVHWYTLTNVLFWLTAAMAVVAGAPMLLGRTLEQALASLRIFAGEFVVCLLFQAMAPPLLSSLVRMFTGSHRVNSLVFNGAVYEVRLKLALLATDLVGAAACLLLLFFPILTGWGAATRWVLVPLFFLRHVLRRPTRIALLQHFATAPHPTTTREDRLPRSIVDVDSKMSRAELMVLGKAMFLYVVVLVNLPYLATAILLIPPPIAQMACSLRAVNALVSDQLNAARLEACIERFQKSECLPGVAPEKVVQPHGQEGPEAGSPGTGKVPAAGGAAATKAVIHPLLINAVECPWVLPAAWRRDATPHSGASSGILGQLMAHAAVVLPSLTVNLRIGAPLSEILDNRVGLSTRTKHAVIQEVSTALTYGGVALGYDEPRRAYFAVLPEVMCCDGTPCRWSGLRDRAYLEDGGDADAIARMRRVPTEGPVWAPMSRRLLWAYFYAYAHHRATAATATPAGAGTGEVVRGVIHVSPREMPPPISVIHALRADGVLDLRSQEPYANVAPTHTSTGAGDEDGESHAAEKTASAGDASANDLRPCFNKFMATLERQGWNLDRFLVCEEGFTNGIVYM